MMLTFNVCRALGIGMSGRGLASLLRVLVASVSAGHFPSLPSLWSSWEGQLLAQARTAALERHATARGVLRTQTRPTLNLLLLLLLASV
jgi:hypothetical protein